MLLASASAQVNNDLTTTGRATRPSRTVQPWGAAVENLIDLACVPGLVAENYKHQLAQPSTS